MASLSPNCWHDHLTLNSPHYTIEMSKNALYLSFTHTFGSLLGMPHTHTQTLYNTRSWGETHILLAHDIYESFPCVTTSLTCGIVFDTPKKYNL